MTLLPIVAAAFLLTATLSAWSEANRGKVTGGEKYQLPTWFKKSFLNFREDVEDAKKQSKHLMVFLHLEECPYCAKQLKENFSDGVRREYIQKHFDVVGLNMRGTAEVVWVDGVSFSERNLAAHLKVIATPAIIFLDPDGKKILQLNGYREPRAFGYALDYVRERQYRTQTLAAYLETKNKPSVYTLQAHPQFSATTNFKGYAKPLAILFEDRQCGECAAFHAKVLNHAEVLPEMRKFSFVRVDTDSKQALVDLTGKITTASAWAKDLELSYRPAVVLFNEGREIARMDGRLYHFHFRERLRYVSGEFYKKFESYSKYSAARREELLQQGVTIDYSE